MRYTELLSMLQELLKSKPEALRQKIEFVSDSGGTFYGTLAITLDAKEKLVFVPVYEYEEDTNGS